MSYYLEMSVRKLAAGIIIDVLSRAMRIIHLSRGMPHDLHRVWI